MHPCNRRMTPSTPTPASGLVYRAAPAPKREWTEADVPEEFAAYLSYLAGRVFLLRQNHKECKERNRLPGVGLMAAALGHVHGWPTYPTREDDRRLMEDLLTILEKEPGRQHEVPALHARIVAHYLSQEAPHA